MAKAATIINGLLWILLGGLCIYPAFLERVHGFMIAFVLLGAGCMFHGLACILQLRICRISSRLVGAVMILYGLDVLLLGHAEDVGGVVWWLSAVAGSIGLGIWSIVLPFGSARAPSLERV